MITRRQSLATNLGAMTAAAIPDLRAFGHAADFLLHALARLKGMRYGSTVNA
jgi:hypothetical protein